MDFLSNVVGGVNWEAIVQLTFVSMIMIAGPVVIFLLAFRGGDL
ncbi:MAG: photosystem II reaction center protein Ycf12 [Oculatellaceae cyanobacterium Prado106]|nr:photosystem II reaction center protein Ycf12 [Oculatellaceae cyanobacterium Prado106]